MAKNATAFADLARRKEERSATGALKRVALLLRVSDKKQTSDDQDVPIPVQRDYCLKLLAAHAHEWEPATREFDGRIQTIEYTEAGVSAFKLSKDDRELLAAAMLDAAADLFDILVIYKTDRLSRNSEEYPIIIRQFANMGVELWVYETGQPLKSSTQVDKLLRFVEGWQAETESVNTRIRVTNAMRRMAENGLWTGGKTPYGYQLKPFVQQPPEAGKARGKKRPVRGIEINENEAKWVRIMFDAYVHQGIGGVQIAGLINNPPYSARKRNGEPWEGPQILQVLKNPIFMGRPAWGKNTYLSGQRVRKARAEWVWSEVHVPDLQIVDEAIWRKAQEVRTIRYGQVAKGKTKMPPRSFTSHLLLTGLAYCGHCGNPLVTKTYSNKRTLADGTVVHDKYEGYMCRNQKRKAQSSCGAARGYWRRALIEDGVLDLVDKWFTQFDFDQVRAKVIESYQESKGQAQAGLTTVRGELDDLLTRRTYYTEQLNLTLLGKQTRIPLSVIEEQLSEIEMGVVEAQGAVTQFEATQNVRLVEEHAIAGLGRILPTWIDAFRTAQPHQRKFLLNQVIDRVTVFDESMEVAVNVKIKELLTTSTATETETAAASERSITRLSLTVHQRNHRGPADLRVHGQDARPRHPLHRRKLAGD